MKNGQEKFEFRLGDTVYRFKRPVLRLVQKYYHMEEVVTSAGDSIKRLMTDTKALQKFESDWKAFCNDCIEKPDDQLRSADLTLVEIINIVGLFFGLASTVNNVTSTLLDSKDVADTKSVGGTS